MGKIYLKVPNLIAAYYRGDNPKHPLACSDAYSFMEGTAEFQLLLLGLRYMPSSEQRSAGCYSSNVWQRMMSGRAIDSGKKILQREKKDWLTAQEICLLTERKFTERQGIFDYLCVSIPKTVYVDGILRPTNDNYSLDRSCAKSLRRALIINFYRVFSQWYLVNKKLIEQLGVKRTMVDFINRFLFAHNIPISTNKKEEDLLRKIIGRGIGGNIVVKDKKELESISILSEIYTDEKRLEQQAKAEEKT